VAPQGNEGFVAIEVIRLVAMNQQWAFPGAAKNRFDTACERSKHVGGVALKRLRKLRNAACVKHGLGEVLTSALW
jgi:hypothetical protein